MDKIGIFGKKNSIVKYNLDSHQPLWIADLPHGQSPKAIAQYEDFLLVIHQNWAGTKNISGGIDMIFYVVGMFIFSQYLLERIYFLNPVR